MRLISRRISFLLPRFVVASALLTVLCFWKSSTSKTDVQIRSKLDICKFTSVSERTSLCKPSLSRPVVESEPCRWDVKVVSSRMPHVHQLRRRDTEPFLPSELHVLERIKGCKSTSSCENSSVTCTYGIEDPSDAFWLRDYNSGIKFVVLFKIGIATLAFFVAAILSDGSIFYPHRVGVSILSGSVLIMVALSAFLYILLVPRTSQLSLYGGGAWQSLGFIVIVITIAALLPGLAVIWVNICVFCVFFVGFFLEQLVYAGIGILHFLGVLTLYQAENTLLHLRLIYFRDIVEDAEFDRQLVIMSTRFLRRVRGNWYLRRVPRALEEDALQFVENLLPDHLYEELMPEDAENIPEVDFDDIHESRENETAREPNNVAEERIPLLRRSVTT